MVLFVTDMKGVTGGYMEGFSPGRRAPSRVYSLHRALCNEQVNRTAPRPCSGDN